MSVVSARPGMGAGGAAQIISDPACELFVRAFPSIAAPLPLLG